MEDLSFKQGLARYKERVSILKKGYLQESYRISILCKSFLADKIIRDITSVDISTYRDQRLAEVNRRTQRLLAPSSVRLELALLSNFFEICKIEWGLTDENPVEKVRKPKPAPGRDRRLTPREDRMILRYAHAFRNKELYAIIVLALTTAMRQGEILSLRWDNIRLKNGIAHLPETKNGTKRDVPLSMRARDVLKSLGTHTSGKVFSYTADGIKSTWRFMLQKLGIQNLRFHDLRHEAVSRLVELGTLDIMEVAAISGHKSLSMLKRYTHLSALRLVSKLEGLKNKGQQAVISSMVPYPAHIVENDGMFTVRFPDLEIETAAAATQGEAIEDGRNCLMRDIFRRFKERLPIPSPDQFLEVIDERQLLMIDPVPC